jgi:hypothetical protein
MEHPPGPSEPGLIIVSDLHLSCPDPAIGTEAGAPSTEPAAFAGFLEMPLRRTEADGTRGCRRRHLSGEVGDASPSVDATELGLSARSRGPNRRNPCRRGRGVPFYALGQSHIPELNPIVGTASHWYVNAGTWKSGLARPRRHSSRSTRTAVARTDPWRRSCAGTRQPGVVRRSARRAADPGPLRRPPPLGRQETVGRRTTVGGGGRVHDPP